MSEFPYGDPIYTHFMTTLMKRPRIGHRIANKLWVLGYREPDSLRAANEAAQYELHAIFREKTLRNLGIWGMPDTADKQKTPRSIKDRLRNPPGPICKAHGVEDCEECMKVASDATIGAMRCEECNAIHSRMVSIAEVTVCRKCLIKALRAIDEYWAQIDNA